ncbi:porin [Pelomonas sp. V22]|uniref:porin n=1 Tax=Pelomonas sp. V22 TaxID=2822139 RepID=UPI0024A865D7|nr:porin [Pelomonas sp. V22]MDI4632571.1 porin [Pelomonas sp. V22]
MQKKSKWRLAPLGMAVLACAGAQAQGGDSPFTFSGFATLGATGTNSSIGEYAMTGQNRGASKSWSGEVDSKLGVQLTAKANQMFSGTVQVLSKQNGDGNFNPEVEWAFAKAQVMPSLSFRLGRMGAPFFAVSDFRDVGYANTWLRPPLDVYGQVPISRFDGGDMIFQTNTGLGSLSAQLFVGKSNAVVQRTDVDFTSMKGFNGTLEMEGGLTLRVGYVRGKLTVKSASLNGLTATLRSVPIAAVSSVGDQLDPNKKDASFAGVGLAWDQGEWLANFEYTQRRTATYVPDTNAWYLTVGHRFGKFTPYATVSQIKQQDSNVNNTIPVGASPTLNALKAGVDGVVAGQYKEQKTQAAGVRWDAYRNVAVKAQLERITPKGPGFFINVPSTFNNRVTVYSLAVDMVF